MFLPYLLRMNLYRYLIIAIVLFAACKQKPIPPAYTWLYGKEQVERLNGHVKQVITERYKGSMKLIECSDFDLSGDLTRVKESFKLLNASPDDQKAYQELEKKIDLQNRLYQFTNKFDSEGRKIEAVGISLSLEDKGDSSIYKFDKHGYLTTAIPASDGLFKNEIYFYTYDNIGNLATEIDSLGKSYSPSSRYKYNKNGSWIERLVYRHGTLDEVDRRNYLVLDNKNNWTKVIESGDTTTRKITYY